MRVREKQCVHFVFLCLLGVTLHAQGNNESSNHRVQMITVEKDVSLEVLDWGGTGRPLVLLTGLGDNEQVFDEFAPKLTAI